tara:strand:- start:1672 stop:2259 length:588 start_codon:yes stop_codon:yes gene_type:complete
MEILDDMNIPYSLNYKKSNRIKLEVNENGLLISGNIKNNKIIEEFISKKKYWIKNNWKKYELTFGKYLYLGKDDESLNSLDKEKLKNFYYNETKRIVNGLVEIYNENNKYNIKNIRIKNQKTRWGSCSSIGNLNFNWKLSMAPYEVIEYVVIHELCHRLEMNHSNKFWRHVKELCPNYKQHSKWLSDNHFRLNLI